MKSGMTLEGHYTIQLGSKINGIPVKWKRAKVQNRAHRMRNIWNRCSRSVSMIVRIWSQNIHGMLNRFVRSHLNTRCKNSLKATNDSRTDIQRNLFKSGIEMFAKEHCSNGRDQKIDLTVVVASISRILVISCYCFTSQKYLRIYDS